MTDIIIGIIVLAILFVAITYIMKAKKSGVKCIGCPHAKTCGSKSCSSKSRCNCH